MIVDFIKNRMAPGSTSYKLASSLYNLVVRPRAFYGSYEAERFRKSCYKEFGKNRSVRLSIHGMDCHYEAISPKNLWHLKTQNGESHSYFGVFLKRGDVVLDIGGHVGTWTVPYAKYVGSSGFVYAFEPEENGFAAIKKNLALNAIGNAKVVQAAIAESNSRMKFYVRPDKDTHSLFGKTSAPSPSGVQHEYEVDVHSIDSLLDTHAIRQPDFIKLDVEGAELLALEGMKRTLLNARAVFVECHDALKLDLGLGEPVELVVNKLREIGAKEIIHVDDSHVIGIFDHQAALK